MFLVDAKIAAKRARRYRLDLPASTVHAVLVRYRAGCTSTITIDPTAQPAASRRSPG
jgi:hypothetical protein